jgi:hypothetical protein
MKKTEMGKTCSTYEEERGAYRILVEKPERRRPLERPRRRWEDNIKIGLGEVRWEHELTFYSPVVELEDMKEFNQSFK